MCLWPGAHTCRQTCDSTKAHGTWSLLLPVWGIRSALSVSLCLCALRYFPLSQFRELLCCSQKHERQRPEDEHQKQEGRWGEIFLCEKLPVSKRMNMKVDTNEGNMAGGRDQSNCLSRFVSRPIEVVLNSPFAFAWCSLHEHTHTHLYSCLCAHAYKCMNIKQVLACTHTHTYNTTHSFDELLIHFPLQRKKKQQLIQW